MGYLLRWEVKQAGAGPYTIVGLILVNLIKRANGNEVSYGPGCKAGQFVGGVKGSNAITSCQKLAGVPARTTASVNLRATYRLPAATPTCALFCIKRRQRRCYDQTFLHEVLQDNIVSLVWHLFGDLVDHSVIVFWSRL